MKVYCAAIECKYHADDNRCTADKLILNEHFVHTKHEGQQQYWTCLQFRQSDRAKEIEERCNDLMHRVEMG